MRLKCSDILLSNIFLSSPNKTESIIDTLSITEQGKVYLFEHLIEILAFYKFQNISLSQKHLSLFHNLVLQYHNCLPRNKDIDVLIKRVFFNYLGIRNEEIGFEKKQANSKNINSELLSRFYILHEVPNNFIGINSMIYGCAMDIHKSDFYNALSKLICIKYRLKNQNNKLNSTQGVFCNQAIAFIRILSEIIDDSSYHWNLKILNSI